MQSVPNEVKEDRPVSTATPAVQIVRMRPTPNIERRRMLREAEEVIEQTDIKSWMERHSIQAKPKRMKVGCHRRDVLKMPDGSTIVIDGSNWMYANRTGLTGEGSLIQFALNFAEPYRSFDITGGAHWHRAVRELAEEICPEVVRYINQRPMTPEETAFDNGVCQEEQPLYTGSHQQAMTEHSRSRQDDWDLER